MSEPDYDAAKEHYKKYMSSLGISTNGPHADDTPRRVVDSRVDELFRGVGEDPSKHLSTTFPTDNGDGDDELVIVDNIAVHSTCAHHHLPFTGFAHVGYIPDGELVGLSKFARVVDGFARRPQVQERLTSQIADAINGQLNPTAVVVMLEARHECMRLRGVQEHNSVTRTTALRGKAKTHSHIKDEFLATVDSKTP